MKSDLLDAHIADGVRYAFRLADERGRPAVVNLSLSGHADAHDGTDPLSQIIDAESGPGRLVCCAAGNEGDESIHAALPLQGRAGRVRITTPVPTRPTTTTAVVVEVEPTAGVVPPATSRTWRLQVRATRAARGQVDVRILDDSPTLDAQVHRCQRRRPAEDRLAGGEPRGPSPSAPTPRGRRGQTRPASRARSPRSATPSPPSAARARGATACQARPHRARVLDRLGAVARRGVAARADPWTPSTSCCRAPAWPRPSSPDCLALLLERRGDLDQEGACAAL